MIQGQLTIWDDESDLTTYSDLRRYRAEAYPKRGPKLLRESLEALEQYERDCEDFTGLKILNDTSQELAALNPLWSDFSLEVFRACLSPNVNSPKMVRGAFELSAQRVQRLRPA